MRIDLVSYSQWTRDLKDRLWNADSDQGEHLRTEAIRRLGHLAIRFLLMELKLGPCRLGAKGSRSRLNGLRCLSARFLNV